MFYDKKHLESNFLSEFTGQVAVKLTRESQ